MLALCDVIDVRLDDFSEAELLDARVALVASIVHAVVDIGRQGYRVDEVWHAAASAICTDYCALKIVDRHLAQTPTANQLNRRT